MEKMLNVERLNIDFNNNKRKKTKMKKPENKTKFATIAIILMLTITAVLVAVPTGNAQPNLIMNCGNQAILNFNFDVDLNGPSEQLTGLKFAMKAPGATEFTLTTDFPIDNEPGLPGERYVTDAGGDCDIDVVFDQAGDWQVKWVHPETGAESDVATITVAEFVYRTTYPYLGVIPNPVGVNQMVLLHVGQTRPLPDVSMGYDLWVEVKGPDGQIEKIENIKYSSWNIFHYCRSRYSYAQWTIKLIRI